MKRNNFVSDRQFFQRNPERRFRFRRPRPGELAELQCTPPPGFLGSLLVEQIAPGIRVRTAVVHSQWPSAALRSDDAYLEEVAALVYSKAPGAAGLAAKLRTIVKEHPPCS